MYGDTVLILRITFADYERSQIILTYLRYIITFIIYEFSWNALHFICYFRYGRGGNLNSVIAKCIGIIVVLRFFCPCYYHHVPAYSVNGELNRFFPRSDRFCYICERGYMGGASL